MEIREIIGNTTATPNPRPDWNQTDETKADYIKNKPAAIYLYDFVFGEADGLDDVIEMKDISNLEGRKVQKDDIIIDAAGTMALITLVYEDYAEYEIKMSIGGKNAYEYAKEGGYTGTEEEFSAKLAADTWYSTPEECGAIGDGVNDDASAFTDAINSGDYVFLTSDLYLFSPVGITGKTRLVVDGNGYTINCKNIERAFQITDSTNIVFRNIIFDGNSCTTQGVTFINCESIQVEKCTFKNMTTTSATDGDTWGLNFRDSKDMRVDFCSFVNIDGSDNSTKVASGIVVHGHTKACENITIANCDFDTILPVTDACGISINQTNFYDTPLHGVVENCRFVDCAKRAVKIMAQHVIVQNCDIKDVLSNDLHASMIDIMASHCRVANNTINVNRATYGISCQYVAATTTITGFSDIIIENNYINVANEDGVTARDGLTIGLVDDTKKYTEVVVRNNVVKGRFRYSFKAMYIANSVIDGNTFDGEVRLGNRYLNDRPCDHNSIVNNTMTGTLELSVTHSLLAHNELIGSGGFGIYFPTYANGSPSNLRILGNHFNNLSYGIDGRRQAMDNIIIAENIFTNITTYDAHLSGTNFAVTNNVLCKGVTGTFEVIPENVDTTEQWTFTLEDGSTVTKAVHVG